MKLLKKIGVCLLSVALCAVAFGCGQEQSFDPPEQNFNQSILPGINEPTRKPATYTPVYASSFGDTIILATVPVEEWHSMESDCPPREISNGGRIKCNGEHEDEVHTTKVLILEDLVPRVCSGWFRDMIYLEEIDGLEKLHIHEVSDMSFMFAGCEKLEKLEVSDWDVSGVTDMTNMFKDCYSLEQIPEWYE